MTNKVSGVPAIAKREGRTERSESAAYSAAMPQKARRQILAGNNGG
jgi:hypothetical protein